MQYIILSHNVYQINTLNNFVNKWKVLPNHVGQWRGSDLRFRNPQPNTSLRYKTTDGASALRGVPMYTPTFTLLGDRSARVWTTCTRLLLNGAVARAQTHDHCLTSPMPLPLDYQDFSKAKS